MTAPRNLIHQALSRKAPQWPVQHSMQTEGTTANPEKKRMDGWRMPPLMPGMAESGPEVKTVQGTIGSVSQMAPMNRPPSSPSGGQTPEKYRMVPQNIGGHAVYRDLMRRHDRMGTQHLPK